MPTDDAEKLAATRLANTLHIPRADAFRALRAAKTDEINWGQAADRILEELAGDGLFPAEVAQ